MHRVPLRRSRTGPDPLPGVGGDLGLARQAPADYEPGLATVLLDTGAALSGLGRALEALAVTYEAVMIERELAGSGSAEHGPGLAAALSDLSCRLYAMDQNDRSLTAAQEALDMCGGAGDGKQSGGQTRLAFALACLWSCCHGLRHKDQALAAAQAAAQIYRRLAVASPPRNSNHSWR